MEHVHADQQHEPRELPVRYVACQATDCVNRGAAYHDYEPVDTAVACPLCGTVMQVIEKPAEPEPPAESDTIDTDA